MKRVIVIPEYNEARTIINVLERAYPFADLVLVVDDGSADGSGALVSQWAADHPGLTLLTLAENQGVSGALLAGFSYVVRLLEAGTLAPDDLVINIDADGQHRPEEIPPAIEAMQARQVDVLLGRRDLTGYPWFKHIGNWGLSLWASLLGGFRYRDAECGFRVMRVDVLVDMLPYFTGRRYGCCQEIAVITARRGWRIDNSFPTRIAYYRPGARVRDGVNNLLMGLTAFLRVTFQRRHTTSERVEDVLSRVVVAPTQQSSTSWTASS